MSEQSAVQLLKVPRLYMEHFLMIRTKAGTLAPLKLKPAQAKLYEAMKREHEAGKPVRIIVLKARQLGFSTVIEGIFFHDAATRPLVRTMILAHDEESTSKLFRMNKLFFDMLPDQLKPMRKNSNAQEIVFENPTRDPEEKAKRPGLMSSIRCVPAAGAGVGRGDTLTNIHASEAAFWRDMNETLDAVMQAVPDSPDTAVVIESTPNGFNAFKTLWDDAEAGRNGFVPLFFAWYEEPGYRRPVEPGTVWSQEEEQLRTAYGLDDEQLTWRRWCIRTQLRGDAEKFKQEYPSCPEEAFLLSGNPFFDNNKILLQLKSTPAPMCRGRFVYGEESNGKPVDWVWQEDAKGEIMLWKQPRERVPFVFGGDTAGDGSDRFTAHGLDNTTGDQVAEMLYDGASELWYAQQLYCLGMTYNTALLAVEINYSTYPERKLEEWGYPRLYIREKPDDMRRELAVYKWGWRTDQRTRPRALANLHAVMEQTPDMVVSERLLGEMLTFIRNDESRPEAAAGAHDDLVMAAAIAHAARDQQAYTESDQTEVRREKLPERLGHGKKRGR